jgi:hypothetical protein
MTHARHWIAGSIALACFMPALAQVDDDYLVPVHYDVYLNKESPLYPFAVDHPCGAIVTLQSNTLPTTLSMVQLQWAYELGPNGEIKARWPLPVDATPVAIAADRLIIHQFSTEEFVFVTTKGGIGTSVQGHPETSGLDKNALETNKNAVECPPSSARADACARLIDKITGKARLIAYPLVCT